MVCYIVQLISTCFQQFDPYRIPFRLGSNCMRRGDFQRVSLLFVPSIVEQPIIGSCEWLGTQMEAWRGGGMVRTRRSRMEGLRYGPFFWTSRTAIPRSARHRLQWQTTRPDRSSDQGPVALRSADSRR